MTIVDWQLSYDMLIEREVLPSKMPKDGSLSGNTKGTACPVLHISMCSFTELVWHIDYRKKYYLLVFFETTEMS